MKKIEVLFVFFLLTYSAQTLPSGIPNLATKTIQEATISDEVVLEGAIEAVKEATVTANLSGIVTEVNFDVNQYIPEGRAILKIKGIRNEAMLNQARASLAEAQANRTEAGNNYSRIKKLYSKELVAKSQLDQAEAALEAASARVNAASAQIQGAQDVLSDNVIKAPFNSYVTKKMVEVGETAQIGTPLFSGFSLDRMRVFTMIPQKVLEAVRKYQNARILLGPDKVIPVSQGDFTFFPDADRATHSVGLRLSLPEMKDATPLYPGMSVKIAFTVGQSQRLTVPPSAIIQHSEFTGVYLVDAKENLKLRHVLFGKTLADDAVEVLSGLESGENVALDPIKASQYLHEQKAPKNE